MHAHQNARKRNALPGRKDERFGFRNRSKAAAPMHAICYKKSGSPAALPPASIIRT